MTEKTIELDQHRGMAAQKATELRRLLADVEANQEALRLRQDELESHLLAAPAANWQEAAEKARYLLNLFAATLAAQDPRRQKLIAAVIADFERLAGQSQRRFRSLRQAFTHCRSEDKMAKGQLRSNREKKKPKADKNKKKSMPATSPFISTPLIGKGSGGKRSS